MVTARDAVERGDDGTDPEAELDRLAEESLTGTGRPPPAPAPLSAAEIAEKFLTETAAFLRRRQDRDVLLARLAEMSRPPATQAPAAETRAPAPEKKTE